MRIPSLALIALLLLLPLFPGRGASLVFGFGYLAASLSDLLDGYLARRFNTTSLIGKFLEPSCVISLTNKSICSREIFGIQIICD